MHTTELSFLLELLLNHKLPKLTKDLVSERIKEVEQRLSNASPVTHVTQRSVSVPYQAPSTVALMEKHGIEIPQPAPVPIEQVAQNPATAQALASRQQAIAQALSGNFPKGQERPRKF